MTELKPCPFCGGEAEMCEDSITAFGKYRKLYVVVCKNLCVKTRQWYSEEQAIEAWNRRANND